MVRFLIVVYLACCLTSLAQEGISAPPPPSDDAKPVPVVSGFAAFVPTWNAGAPTLVSIISPVILAPLGNNLVFESRGAFEGDFQRRNGTSGDFTGGIQKSLDYAELDYIGNRYLTVTAGRFLTPFNIFNERLYPNWIRNTQSDPLILPIGTGSDNGLMLRGAVPVSRNLDINYAIYGSVLSNSDYLESERHAGFRFGAFLPRERFEIGMSFQRQLQDGRLNRYGWHLQWQPSRTPLEIRAEGAYSQAEGSGLWLEGAYRLTNAPQSFLRRAQLVGRTQFFETGSASGTNPALASVDTKRTEFGVNYYLNDGWKALASYGRTFTAEGNSNIWTIGMTYRFVFPLGPKA